MLTGIILMGGRSSRMGSDKSQLTLDSTSFAQLAEKKLKPFCDTIHFSINSEQEKLKLKNSILDKYNEEGPLSGVISSLEATQQSILVLAVDMPLVSNKTIETLIAKRNWNLLSTAYYREEDRIWEPFPSIWEIEALPALKEYFSSGERSFQKFLNKYGNQRVSIDDINKFKNINTIEQYEKLETKEESP